MLGLFSKERARPFLKFFVLTVLLFGVVAAVNAQATPSNPNESETSLPLVVDGRACGDFPGGLAHTAAVYPITDDQGHISGLLMYEVNDNSVSTFVDEVPSNNTISNALQSSAQSQSPVTFFNADTYSVSALPNGLCQINSIQIPVGEGKGFTCTFACK